MIHPNYTIQRLTMKDEQKVNVYLKTRAAKELEEQVAEELEIEDPSEEKAKASLRKHINANTRRND